MRTSKRLTTTLVAIGAAALLGTACGDDDGGSPDANTPADAASAPDGAPDGGPPAATRAATLAVTDVRVTTEGGTSFGGSAISLAIDDLTMGGVAPAFNSGRIGGCQVFQYKATGTPRPYSPAGEGNITISGTGVLKPTGTCAFNNGAYNCITDTGTGAAGTVTALGVQGAVSVSITGETFDPAVVRGQYLQITGVPAGTGKGTNGDVYNGVFPIINATGSSVTIVNSRAANAEGPIAFTAASFALVQGVGPVPGGAAPGAAGVNFLSDDPANTVTVSLASGGTAYPNGINATLQPIGAGFTLVEADAVPNDPKTPEDDSVPRRIGAEDFPFDATQPVQIHCEGEGCGDPGTEALAGIVVSGRTTDGSTTGLPAFLMPAPQSDYATFTCTNLVAPTATEGTVTIPAAAIAEILETNPTRVELRVLRVSFSSVMVGNTSTVIVGHGVVGHSTRPSLSN